MKKFKDLVEGNKVKIGDLVYIGQNDGVGTVTELADKYFTWESGEDIYETLYSDSGKAEKKVVWNVKNWEEYGEYDDDDDDY